MAEDISDEIIHSYMDFCASPLRNSYEIADDFNLLISDPNIKMVAFHKPHVLMIGTELLTIPLDNHIFEIGELIIFFIRKRVGRVWQTSFWVSNVTGSLRDPGQERNAPGTYIHPHIKLSGTTEIDGYVGELCISKGQFAIYQSLRLGYIPKAFSLLWDTLRVYGSGQPFKEIGYWPSRLKEKHDD